MKGTVMSEKRETLKSRIETFKNDIFPIALGAGIGACLVAISYGGAYYGAKEGAQRVQINFHTKNEDGTDKVISV